jgi:hypothetical protein
MDERPRSPDESQPADFKTACDGTGGLVRVRFVGPPHDGRSLYMDELDLPAVIYTTGTADQFEWWDERIQPRMETLRAEAGAAAAGVAPPVRHTLVVPEDTRQPVFESERRVAVG